MTVAVACHALTAAFAGAEKHDFVFGGGEGNRFESGSGVAVVAKGLALAETAAAPEISETFQHPHGAGTGVGHSGQ